MRIGLALIFLGALAACGRGGDGNGSDDGAPSGGGGGAVQPGAKDVTASFAIGSAAKPASGYEVWLFDHTAPALQRVPLGAAGKISLPVANFVEGHTYSFHLVDDDFRVMGDVDLSAVNAGVQAAFVYQGGYGFDLGQMVLGLDRYGDPDPTTGPLTGQIGGGFSIAGTTSGAFDTYPLPPVAADLQLGSQLFVMDPATLLYSFYLKAQNPSLYARDVQRLARLGLLVTAPGKDKVTKAWVSSAGRWLAGARLPVVDDTEPEAAPLWSAGGDVLTQIDETRFAASIFTGGLPSPRLAVVISVRPTSGAEAAVPLTPPRIVAFPPAVTAFGGSVVDYTSATGENGLTRPFCQTGDVTLTTAPPATPSGEAIKATVLDVVTVAVDYFGDSGGKTTKLSVAPADLPAPYNAVLEDTSVTDLKRSWDPAQLALRFDLGASVAAQATQDLTLWSALFPATIGGETVTKVRLRIYYRSDKEATSAAVAVWLRKGC